VYLIVVIVALVLIIAGCLPTVPSTGQGNTELLTNKNPGVVLNVTTGSTYTTIQAAIDASSDGDAINVAAGTYEEEIKIKGKSLTLSGAQAGVPIVNGGRAGGESIIRGKGTSGYPSSWCVVRIQHSDVIVNGFTIEKGQRGIAIQGIKPDGISNILVSYNYIEESGKDGIFRDNAAIDVTITHNYIADNPRGIATRGGVTTITDNTFDGNGKGIDFLHGDPTSMYFPDYDQPNYPSIISDNIFTNDKTSIKLSLRGHQSITIEGNDITEARTIAIETSGWGVDLINPAIHYNNIYNNEFGINNQVTEINLDATCNWWGDASGPYHASNPNDLGDKVSDNVDFSPWLLSLAPDAMCYDWYGFEYIVECAEKANNHGKFVSCVAHLTNDWLKNGDITAEEKGAIMSWAARSDIGKR